MDDITQEESERRVDLAERLTAIEGALKSNCDLVGEMHTALMGKDGVVVKQAVQAKSIVIQWWAISIMLAGIIGRSLWSIWK